jgi:hypothetical protein
MFSPCDKLLLVGWADAHLVDPKRTISGISVEAHFFSPKAPWMQALRSLTTGRISL